VRLQEKGGKRHEMPAGLKGKLGCQAVTCFVRPGSPPISGPAARRKTHRPSAAHESARTTKPYDRTGDEITLDEVERITI
jgi:hypothetical protein